MPRGIKGPPEDEAHRGKRITSRKRGIQRAHDITGGVMDQPHPVVRTKSFLPVKGHTSAVHIGNNAVAMFESAAEQPSKPLFILAL